MSQPRWDAVFADLAAEFDALAAEGHDEQVRALAEAELAAIPLVARMQACVERPITLAVAGAGVVSGTVVRAAPEWIGLNAGGEELIVATAAVLWVRGFDGGAAPFRPTDPAGRLGIGSVLRRLARSGAAVGVVLVDGSRHHGVIGRVGSDWFEVGAEAAPAAGPVAATVRFGAVAVVRAR